MTSSSGALDLEEAKVNRTLVYSILDGLAYSIMVGAGETYFIPYALFLGGSDLILGLFVALPIFVGSLSQLFSARLLVLLKSRKRLVSAGILGQALTFIPVVAIHELPLVGQPELFLAMACLYWVFGLIVGPSWSSLMGDVVPESKRGAYFGRRNRYMQIVTFLSIVAGGLVLFFLKERGAEFTGFVLIFSVAFGARLLSLLFLLLHSEPPMESPPTRRTLPEVVTTLRNRDQRALIIYLTSMNLAVYLAAPFFSAYMLRPPARDGVAWSYVTYTAVNGITVFFKFVFLPVWGGASDRFGSRKCLALSAWLVSGLPACWLFPRTSPDLYFIVICLVQAWGGFAWAGHELCAFNFLLDSAPARARPSLVASMNIVNGVMVFLGSTVGAVVVSLAPAAVNRFQLVFFLSSMARFAVCALLLRRLREVRVVERISYRTLFFRVSSVRANIGPVMRFFVLPIKRRAN